MSKEQPVAHYVFLRPGEKIIILTDKCAGDTDYTHVFEVAIPTKEYDDTLYHNPEGEHMTDTYHRQVLELNDCGNLTADGGDLLSNFARTHSTQHGRRPFITAPLEIKKPQPEEL